MNVIQAYLDSDGGIHRTQEAARKATTCARIRAALGIGSGGYGGGAGGGGYGCSNLGASGSNVGVAPVVMTAGRVLTVEWLVENAETIIDILKAHLEISKE